MKIEHIISKFISKDGNESNFMQIFGIFAASLGGFTMGAQMAWPSVSLPRLLLNSSYIGQISLEQGSYFSFISSLSMTTFAFFVCFLMKFVGRKYIIGFMAVPYAVSLILIAEAKSLVVIYLARLVLGISDSISYCTVFVYVGEIATPDVRGKWGNMFTTAVFLGHLVIAVVSVYCNVAKTARILLFAPLLQAIVVLFVPDSPYYFLMKGKVEDARIALRLLRWRENVEDELANLIIDNQRQTSKLGTFKDLFSIATNRRACLIAIALRTFQQFSGLIAFVVYVHQLFHLSGIYSIPEEVSSIIYYAILFFLTTFGCMIINKYGRRTMLIVSSICCTISMLIESVYFYIMEETDIDVSSVQWMPLFGMVCYIASITAGFSLLPNLMTGELFSASVKNYAMLVTVIHMGLCMIIVPKLFEFLLDHYGTYIPFILFTISCLLSIPFCCYCIPETKGKTLEEIQLILSKR